MPRKQKKYHYLYKTTNLINNKFYVGIHSTDDLNDGYLGSGKYLWYSIRKYGKENFKIEFLEFFDDRINLAKRESEIINEEFINNSLCMNLKKGGDGGSAEWTDDMKKEKSIAMTGAGNPMFGKKRTKEEREKISKNHADFNGKNNGMYGKTHTDEAKETLRKCLIIKNKKEFICEHCNRIIKGVANFNRFHKNNCKLKKYKLFLDDERFPKLLNDWTIVRNFEEFKKIIKERGLPIAMSLDHDLNQENGIPLPTGYDCIKWMVYDMKYDLRNIDINVHSANPVGEDNIYGLVKSWNKFLNNEEQIQK